MAHERMTKKMLENAVKCLNNETDREGMYEVESMYGKCRLVWIATSKRRTVISNLGTKRHVFDIVDAIRTVKLVETLEDVRF